MLAEHKLKILLDLISSSSKEELAWMNGYISSQLAPAAIEAANPQKFASNTHEQHFFTLFQFVLICNSCFDSLYKFSRVAM